MKYDTQKRKLIAWLCAGHSITTMQAMRKFLICRLSERIRELEKQGYKIVHYPETINGHSWTKYFLKGKYKP